jgi:two-component system sensor histidine kinase KdpD
MKKNCGGDRNNIDPSGEFGSSILSRRGIEWTLLAAGVPIGENSVGTGIYTPAREDRRPSGPLVQSSMRPKSTHQFWKECPAAGASCAVIALLTWICYRLHINNATIVLAFLLVVVVHSLTGRLVASLVVALSAAGCLDFFFLPPALSFRVDNPIDAVALIVFPIMSLVVTRQVSRVREEAQRARRRGTEVEQLYEVARRLLLLTPDQVGGVPALKIFREVLGSDAVCLFDAGTAEISTDGISQYDLAERTRQAYIFGKDIDDTRAGVFVRCLRVGHSIIGAIGFEGRQGPATVLPTFPILAAAALDRAHSFRRAGTESAAAQAEVFRTAILDALAHEFKTPLATILAVAGGIRESGKLDSAQEELAGMIESEASRLSHLTTQLVRTARLDREELKPRLKRIDIVKFVERVVHRYTAHSPERRVAIDSCRGSVEAPIDPQLLDLALTQLLDNAVKYSATASDVTVGVRTEGAFAMISVGNEGSSIAPDEQSRIFERFYRGTRVRNLVSGTGLGLYVARKIADAHGGSLDLVNDEQLKHVVFCLKLPMVNHGHDNSTGSR